MIRGPGTVGLDSSVTIDELVNTTLEALEYFGVYNISRHYTYHPASLNNEVVDPHDNVVMLDNVGSEPALNATSAKAPSSDTDYRSPLQEDEEVNDENRDVCNESNSPGMAVHNSNKASTSLNTKQPLLPDDLILDRRVSMGVYSLFTRF